jgi:hypothetical protein
LHFEGGAKQDGYCIKVRYKSDPGLYYDYQFFAFDKSKIFSYESIRCGVYKDNGDYAFRNGRIVKYPPLDEQV